MAEITESRGPGFRAVTKGHGLVTMKSHAIPIGPRVLRLPDESHLGDYTERVYIDVSTGVAAITFGTGEIRALGNGTDTTSVGNPLNVYSGGRANLRGAIYRMRAILLSSAAVDYNLAQSLCWRYQPGGGPQEQIIPMSPMLCHGPILDVATTALYAAALDSGPGVEFKTPLPIGMDSDKWLLSAFQSTTFATSRHLITILEGAFRIGKGGNLTTDCC